MDKKQFMIIKEKAKDAGIGACNIVAKKIMEKKVCEGDIVYVASTPQGSKYGGFEKNTTRAYVWKDDQFRLLFYNTKSYRAKIAIQNYNKYREGIIDHVVWNNYVTNGWNTRRGLLRSIRTPRMELISRSHELYGDGGVEAHDLRVFLRN